MDSKILKDVWPPVPKHIETKVAELEAEVAAMEERLFMYEEFDAKDDGGRFDPPHPIFLLAEENDKLRAEVAALKGTSRAMFAAEEEYGCGFYNYPKWVAAYSTLAALVEGKQDG